MAITYRGSLRSDRYKKPKTPKDGPPKRSCRLALDFPPAAPYIEDPI